ncbi:MAG: hypothetical protein EA366_04580 [Spirulina sp. DLM2.Bin59]|nr:MAG: hypothetical protein EA366_04580 [Spirulina sp. DLM2.Bin59]
MSQERGIVQRVLIILSGVAFLGGTAVMGLSMMTSTPPPSSSASSEETPEDDAQTVFLESQEAGYVSVLEREPENPIALEGLVKTRIELGKLKEALPPLQKLSELEPENQDYIQAIAAIHIQTEDYEGAIAPFEKLVALNPDDQELKDQLDQLKTFLENDHQESTNE